MLKAKLAFSFLTKFIKILIISDSVTSRAVSEGRALEVTSWQSQGQGQTSRNVTGLVNIAPPNNVRPLGANAAAGVQFSGNGKGDK